MKKDFYQLFIYELKDMYSGEKQMIKALPGMIDAAHSSELKQALQHHFKETKEQLARLQEIEKELNEDLSGTECKAMQGLIKEAHDALKLNFSGAVRDAAIISYAQRIEHYEMAVYGTLRCFAKHLKLANVKNLLDETLKEEGCADKKLTEIAEGSFFTAGLNVKAKKAA